MVQKGKIERQGTGLFVNLRVRFSESLLPNDLAHARALKTAHAARDGNDVDARREALALVHRALAREAQEF